MTEADQQQTPIQLLEIPISISSMRGKPCIILKKASTDMEVMKTILSAAFHGQPVVILPKFTNTTQTINSLLEKGIIYRDTSGQFFYTL